MTRKTVMIDINFARSDFRSLLLIRRGLMLLVAIAAIVLFVLSLWARSYRTQVEAAQMQVKNLASSEEKLRPVMAERQQLVGNLNAMTGLLQARRFSWSRFLTHLEEVFPEGIALTRLELNPRDLTASLEGFAHSPEALSRLMIGLQQSRSFKNPLLKRQSMDKGILSFNVIVHYSETPAGASFPGTDQQQGR